MSTDGTSAVAPDDGDARKPEEKLQQPRVIPMVEPPNAGEIARGLRLLVPKGMTFEARMLGVVDNPRYPGYTMAGWFDTDHIDLAAKLIAHWSPLAEGCYFTINPVDPELKSIANNCLKKRPKSTTADVHILMRVRLIIDADPVRRSTTTGKELPPDIPSTDAEKTLARERINATIGWLVDEMGWPSPTAVCDSGNGYHAAWDIDLPAEDDLVGRVLDAVSHRFTDDKVKIDTTLRNAARIIKVYGSIARKGENTEARPHRTARILNVSAERITLSRELMEAVAATMPQPQPAPQPERRSEPAGERSDAPGRPSVETRAILYLDKCTPAISGQDGHNTTFSVACRVGPGFDLPEDVALRLIRERYNPRCQPPWSDKELEHKVKDAYAKNPCRGWLRDADRQPEVNRPGFPRNDQPSEAAAGVIPWPVGTRVRASDRDNIGDIDEDNGGAKVHVHFKNNETGEEAYVWLRRSILTPVSDEEEAATTGPSFTQSILGAKAFFGTEYRMEWLIRRILVAEQPCVFAAPKKGMKTSMAVDLIVSLATAHPYLNCFDIPAPVPVLILSGESGGFVIQDTARRVCRAKGIEPDSMEGNFFIGFELPQLSVTEQLQELAGFITDHSIKVVIIDPVYLCLLSGQVPGRSLNAGNLFDMGPLLMRISKSCLDAGATPILIHHFKKNIDDPYKMPELEDITFAGFQEFARQWLLLGRREAFVPGSGFHPLWMTVGGSAGHSGEWAVDITEGVMGDDFRGRSWDVQVRLASEARAMQRVAGQINKEDKQAERARTRDEAKDRQRQKDATAAIEKLRRLGQATPKAWSDSLNWSREKMGPVAAYLREVGFIRPCKIIIPCGKGTRQLDGWEPVPDAENEASVLPFGDLI